MVSMLFVMSRVERVTLSLHGDLLDRIEKLRREQGTASRSGVMADLLWRGWQQVESEEREARYRVAYQAQPDTEEELAWADGAGQELLAGDAGWAGDAESTTHAPR